MSNKYRRDAIVNGLGIVELTKASMLAASAAEVIEVEALDKICPALADTSEHLHRMIAREGSNRLGQYFTDCAEKATTHPDAAHYICAKKMQLAQWFTIAAEELRRQA